MLITLKQADALSLAGIEHAASTDKARPTLAALKLEWEISDDGSEATVQAVTTDSYKLMIKRAVFEKMLPDSHYGAFMVEDGDPQKGELVIEDAKAVSKALKEAVKAVKGKPIPVVLAVGADELVVTTETQAVAYSFRIMDVTFPNYASLLPDDHKRWIERGEVDDPSPSAWPAFNGDYLAKLLRGLNPELATKKASPPVRVLGGVSDLKPWGFGFQASNTLRFRSYGLIMPVRV